MVVRRGGVGKSYQRHQKMSSFSQAAANIAQQFHVTSEQIQDATDHFVDQLAKGLRDPCLNNVQVPSFVTYVPTGDEKGTYLTADLGGTNLRVCIVELHGASKYTTKQSKIAVPQALMVSESWQPLFRFVAQHIRAFLQSYELSLGVARDALIKAPIRRLAFTFSFTVDQTSIGTGTLLKWDKGFDIPTAVGKDPCAMLQYALDQLDVPVLVAALANDTVSTLMAQHYLSGGRAVVGAIFGTGTNGAYTEKACNIMERHQNNATSGIAGSMIISTEWGAFDDVSKRLPYTVFDVELDQQSLHPGEQRYEKLVSGMYLGEIFRKAILEARKRCAPTSINPTIDGSPLSQEYQVPTSLLSVLAIGESRSCHVRALKSTMGIPCLSSDEVKGMRTIAKAIGLRAARLAGIAISAVILKSGHLQASITKEPRLFSLYTLSLPPRYGPFVVIANLHKACRWLWHCIFGKGRVVPLVCQLQKSVISSSLPRTSTAFHVGLDGSLAEFYPGFVEGIRETFRHVRGIGTTGDKLICIEMVKDSSSIGAALVAHAAEEQARNVSSKA